MGPDTPPLEIEKNKVKQRQFGRLTNYFWMLKLLIQVIHIGDSDNDALCVCPEHFPLQLSWLPKSKFKLLPPGEKQPTQSHTFVSG